MAKKITDEQILEVLQDPKYKSEKERAEALGVKVGGTINNRFRAIREQYGLPDPEPSKRGRPKKDQGGGIRSAAV